MDQQPIEEIIDVEDYFRWEEPIFRNIVTKLVFQGYSFGDAGKIAVSEFIPDLRQYYIAFVQPQRLRMDDKNEYI